MLKKYIGEQKATINSQFQFTPLEGGAPYANGRSVIRRGLSFAQPQKRPRVEALRTRTIIF